MDRRLSPAEKDTRALVAKNLRHAMTWWTDLTATGLAKKARVSRATVFNTLGGHSAASLDVLTRLSGALGIEVKELLGDLKPYEDA